MKVWIAALILTVCSVASAQEVQGDTVPAGTGINQIPEVSEVTRLGNSALVAEYMPLDKGNVWTYSIKSGQETKEHKQSIVSESGGWSVFDSYFGKEAVALRITPGGELFVTNQGHVSSFYGNETTTSFPEGTYKTPAGNFSGVMLVTMPEGKDFWFRDVYVKGVGLVFHEHKTADRSSSYTLINAKIRGKDYTPE